MNVNSVPGYTSFLPKACLMSCDHKFKLAKPTLHKRVFLQTRSYSWPWRPASGQPSLAWNTTPPFIIQRFRYLKMKYYLISGVTDTSGIFHNSVNRPIFGSRWWCYLNQSESLQCLLNPSLCPTCTDATKFFWFSNTTEAVNFPLNQCIYTLACFANAAFVARGTMVSLSIVLVRHSC